MARPKKEARRLPSPFPHAMGDGRFVLEQRCTCGKLRVQHEDTAFEYGHGATAFTCLRFTWAANLFYDPATDKLSH